MKTDVLICVESSHERGMGHLFRAITLAKCLCSNQVSVVIVCNNHSAALAKLHAAGCKHHILQMGYNELEVLGQPWEIEILEKFNPTLWLDDRMALSVRHKEVLADKVFTCSIDDLNLVNATTQVQFEIMPYAFTGKQGRDIHAGIKYTVLAPAFAALQRLRGTALSEAKILVNMGGSDTYNATCFVVQQLLFLERKARVITGPSFAHNAQLLALLEEDKKNLISCSSAVADLAQAFAEHDLLICAGGVTPFEAAANGLPTIVLATEKHEQINAETIEHLGFGVYMGKRQGKNFEGDLKSALDKIQKHGLSKMSKTAMSEVDGQGAQRITNIIVHGLEKLREK